VDLPSAIARARATYDTLRSLRDSKDRIGDTAVQGQLASAMADLADVMMALIDAREELEANAAETLRLRRAFRRRLKTARLTQSNGRSHLAGGEAKD